MKKFGKYVDCAICEKNFYVSQSRLKNKHHTCSKSCQGILLSRLHSRKIQTNCIICKKKIFYKKSAFKQVAYPTCSAACASKSKSIRYRGRNNPNALKLNKLERFFWDRANNYAYRAKAKKIDYDLDYVFLLNLLDKQNGKCFYTELEMQLFGKKAYNTLSLDRIDSNLGYTRDNVVFCINAINMLKSDHSIVHIKKIFKAIVEKKHTINVKFKRMHEDAILPSKKHYGDAGYDLYINRIEEDEQILKVFTGIAAEPEIGYFFMLVPRSSACKKGLILHNGIGIIDNNYRNEIIGIFLKTNNYTAVNKNDRLLQLVPQKQIHLKIKEVSELTISDRNMDGFGSTGK